MSSFNLFFIAKKFPNQFSICCCTFRSGTIREYIFFIEISDGTSLWRISAEGGTPQKVWESEKRVEFFSIHPDGKQIIFTIREGTTEIRLIEGLVQELAKNYNQNE